MQAYRQADRQAGRQAGRQMHVYEHESDIQILYDAGTRTTLSDQKYRHKYI